MDLNPAKKDEDDKKQKEEPEEEAINTRKEEQWDPFTGGSAKEEEKEPAKLKDQSMEIISLADIESSFEHLSNVDPDDEWVKTSRVSLVKSVLSSSSGASLSDYSIVGKSVGNA